MEPVLQQPEHTKNSDLGTESLRVGDRLPQDLMTPEFSPMTAGLKHHSWTRRALWLSRSQDEDRPSLQGILMDPDFNMAVSCDGRRLFASQRDYYDREGAHPVYSGFDFDSWFFMNVFKSNQGPSYPDWKKTLPDQTDAFVRFRVPNGISSLYLDPEDYMEYRCFLSVHGVRILTEPERKTSEEESSLRMLNLAYLIPMEGKSVIATWKKDEEKSPIVFMPNQSQPTANPEFLKTLPWFAVVMPMRL